MHAVTALTRLPAWALLPAALELDILTAAVNEDHTVEDGISYDSKLQTATLTFASPVRESATALCGRLPRTRVVDSA